MDTKFINRLISQAIEENSEMSMEMAIPDGHPAAKITIEIEGQETIVFDNAEQYVVYTGADDKRGIGLSVGNLIFFEMVLKSLSGKMLESLVREIPKLAVYAGGKK